MLKWFRKWLDPHDVIRVPEPRRVLPKCHIRAFCDGDFEVCAEIYRLNEGKHFPVGVFENFAEKLRDEQKRPLELVAEVDGAVRAYGGICRQMGLRWAFLSYGMVHPQFQRCGFGTAVLLARVVALGKPKWDWRLALTTAGPSASFYDRFGFRYTGRFKVSDPVEMELDNYEATVTANAWSECEEFVRNSEVSFDASEVNVPERDFLAG